MQVSESGLPLRGFPVLSRHTPPAPGPPGGSERIQEGRRDPPPQGPTCVHLPGGAASPEIMV